MRLNADSLPRGAQGRCTDYERWTIEELRAFGAQLQLPDARRKTREELLEILDVRLTGSWGKGAARC
jgi:hypothetical protein